MSEYYSPQEMSLLITSMENAVRHIQVSACDCGQKLQQVEFKFEAISLSGTVDGDTMERTCSKLMPRLQITYQKP